MLQLLSNSQSGTHLEQIQELMSTADEAYIMVAFLKMSGLKRIQTQLSKVRQLQIIAGANFGLTEPVALTELLRMTNGGDKKAFLNRMDSKQIFHPKMYLFRAGKEGHIIIGSANLTGGGLEKNNECSLYTKCDVSDRIWSDTMEYFSKCVSMDQADPLSERIIGLYTGYYLKQKEANKKVEEFPDVSGSLIYDLKNLKKLYDGFDHAEIDAGIEEKEGYYREAKQVLEKIASRQHPDKKFKELLEDLVGKEGQYGLWYSNGMYRQKGAIFGQQDAFRDLIKFIRKNLDKTPGFIYNGAREIMKRIKGVGPNYVGEIMMTYAPEKLANINRNPITVLIKEGCANLKDHSQKFKGADYEEYNNIVKDIADRLGLKNMLAADYFFNKIYQKLKEMGKLKR